MTAGENSEVDSDSNNHDHHHHQHHLTSPLGEGRGSVPGGLGTHRWCLTWSGTVSGVDMASVPLFPQACQSRYTSAVSFVSCVARARVLRLLLRCARACNCCYEQKLHVFMSNHVPTRPSINLPIHPPFPPHLVLAEAASYFF